VKLPGGGIAIVKHANGRTPKCAFCRRASTKLCDGVIGRRLDGKEITCDIPMCDEHIARQIGERDYCMRCHAHYLETLAE